MYRYFVIDDLFKINEDIKNKGGIIWQMLKT